MNKIIIATVLIVSAGFLGAPVVSAESAASGENKPKAEKSIKNTQEKGEKLVDKRVEDLNKLAVRIAEFRNISEPQKASIIATIQGLAKSLTDLKAEIASTTISTTTLKADMDAITKGHRIYALVMPQLHIVAASDRVITVMNMMAAVGAKMEVRLNNLAGQPNEAEIRAALVAYGEKLIKAKTAAETAFNSVSVLVPDDGDKTKMAANTEALKSARAQIKLAEKEIGEARKDIRKIGELLAKAEKNMKKIVPPVQATSTPATVSATTTATTTTE